MNIEDDLKKLFYVFLEKKILTLIICFFCLVLSLGYYYFFLNKNYKLEVIILKSDPYTIYKNVYENEQVKIVNDRNNFNFKFAVNSPSNFYKFLNKDKIIKINKYNTIEQSNFFNLIEENSFFLKYLVIYEDEIDGPKLIRNYLEFIIAAEKENREKSTLSVISNLIEKLELDLKNINSYILPLSESEDTKKNNQNMNTLMYQNYDLIKYQNYDLIKMKNKVLSEIELLKRSKNNFISYNKNYYVVKQILGPEPNYKPSIFYIFAGLLFGFFLSLSIVTWRFIFTEKK